MSAAILKFASKIFESNSGSLKLPYKLNFVVTKECHSRCLNCNIWKEKPKNELTLEEIRSLAVNTPYLSWINFTGGEPTDRKDFVEIVQAFVDSCPDLYLVHFPTNGLKPNRINSVASEISKLTKNRLVVTVSIDGPPDVNDRLRGIPGDFKKAVETLRGLQEIEGLNAVVGMTIYPDNHHLIKETLTAIKQAVPKFDSNLFHVNLPNVSKHFYGNSGQTEKPTHAMLASLREYQKSRGYSLSPLDWLERRYQKLALEFLDSGETPLECAALLSSCYLSEKGDLYPCTIWDKSIGNIRNHNFDLKPLLTSQLALDLRSQIKQKQCPNCWTPCEAYQTVLANVA